MKESRRDFIQTSIALGVLTVTKATAQPGSPAAGPIINKKIALLVSTKKKDNHIAAFSQALRARGWNSTSPPLFADHKYGPNHRELKNLTKQHVLNGVDLLVAAGGLPAAVAVASVVNHTNAAPPFIFLIGRYPTSNSGVDFYAAELYNSPSTKKVGGVDQNIPAQNGANFQALYTQGGVAIDKVGLIVNDNNPITLPEVSGWTSLTVSGTSTDPDFIYHLTGENDQGIQPLLDDIRNSPQPDGIVVSSDPYLREVGNAGFDAQLRRAGTGGNFAGWVCYPFKEYVLSGANSIYSASTPVLATDVPTDTTTAYYQLGLKADDALHQRPPMLTQWTGSAWASVAFP